MRTQKVVSRRARASRGSGVRSRRQVWEEVTPVTKTDRGLRPRQVQLSDLDFTSVPIRTRRSRATPRVEEALTDSADSTVSGAAGSPRRLAASRTSSPRDSIVERGVDARAGLGAREGASAALRGASRLFLPSSASPRRRGGPRQRRADTRRALGEDHRAGLRIEHQVRAARASVRPLPTLSPASSGSRVVRVSPARPLREGTPSRVTFERRG